MSILHNFRQYTLKDEDYVTVITGFSIFWVIAFIFIKSSLKTPKQLAWGISLINSLVLSIVGLVYVYEMTIQLPQFQNFQPPGKQVFEKVDNVSCLICVWMITANIVDLVFGFIFYRSELGLLTAYIHHTFYIWASYGFLTGNGLFFTAPPHPGGFSLCMMEEIPTLLLAIGSISSKYRTDVGFGLTFFLLRIVYHAYILIYQIYFGVHLFPVLVTAASMILHIFWFHGWVTKYGKKFFSSSTSKTSKTTTKKKE